MPKISALPAAAPLTGAEIVPIVQDGATVQTTAEALARLNGGGVPQIVTDAGTTNIAALKTVVIITRPSGAIADLGGIVDTAEVGDTLEILCAGTSGQFYLDLVDFTNTFLDANGSNAVDFEEADSGVRIRYVGVISGARKWFAETISGASLVSL